MAISPARAAAFDILLRVEQQDAYASDLLHAEHYAKLSPADHDLATELTMGVLRWLSVLDRDISAASSQPLKKLDAEVLIALRLATYQMRHLDRIPARAAIHESVELVKRARKRSAAPFVNAILRKLSQMTRQSTSHLEVLKTPSTSESLAAASAHPTWIVERWAREFGLETTQLICAHDQSVPMTTIRLRDAATEEELRHDKIELTPGSVLASARSVRARDIARTQAFRDGRIAIQDEASQLVARLVGKGSHILDCCAAPGGKTAAIADRIPESTIIAAELHPHRTRLLRRLVSAGNVQVLAADARKLPFTCHFDRVLVDVPCSGTGTLARNPEIKWRLRPEDLADLQARQLSILQSAMSHVKPGGRLLYATCSLEREENSDVVEKAIASDKSVRLLDCRPELEILQKEGELVWRDLDSLISGPFFRTIPGVHPCDGFFATILEKI
jgi:16S rRNA (cytosine967-C5)-methyltransferase